MSRESRAPTLASLLDEATLAELAGMPSFARGVACHRDGRVELGAAGGERAVAVVRGTLPHEVALWVALSRDRLTRPFDAPARSRVCVIQSNGDTR